MVEMWPDITGPLHLRTTSALRQLMRFREENRRRSCCRDGRSIAVSIYKADLRLILLMQLTTSPESAAPDPSWAALASNGLSSEIRAISILGKRRRLLVMRFRVAGLPVIPTAYRSR